MPSLAGLEGSTLFPLTRLLPPRVFPGLEDGPGEVLARSLARVEFVEAVALPLEHGCRVELIALMEDALVLSPLGTALELVLGAGTTVFEAAGVVEYRDGGPALELELTGVALTLRGSSGLLSALPRRIALRRLGVQESRGNLSLALRLELEGGLTLGLPGLELFSLVLGASGSSGNLLDFAVTLGPNAALALHGFQAALRIHHPMVRPVVLMPGDPSDYVEARVAGSLSVSADLSFTADLGPFDLSPFTLPGTGLTLALRGCQFLSGDTSPDRGLLAREATLIWLPQCTFDGRKGLHVELRDVVLATEGVSLRAALAFEPEVAGFLFAPEWRVSLRQVAAEVVRNVPRHFSATGSLAVPPLHTSLALELGLQVEPVRGVSTFLRLRSEESLSIQVGPGTLRIDELRLSGELGETGLALEGTAHELSLDLAPLHVEAARAAISLAHDADGDRFSIELEHVPLGVLGTVERAVLHVQRTRDATGQLTEEVFLETVVGWEELRGHLPLAELPEVLPLPPDDATVTATLHWQRRADGGHRLLLGLAAGLSDIDALWSFVPEPFRPEVREVRFVFEAVHESTETLPGAGAALGGTVGVSFAFRLPRALELPGFLCETKREGDLTWLSLRLPFPDGSTPELLRVHGGDAEGWIRAGLRAELRDGRAGLRGELHELLCLDAHLPGFPQPRAPFHAELKDVLVHLEQGTSTAGALELRGRITLRPFILPPTLPAGPYLQQLLAPLAQLELGSEVELALRLRDGRAMLEVQATFEKLGAIDLFGTLAALASGRSTQGGTGKEVTLPQGFVFSMDRARLLLRLGALETGPQVEKVALELTFGVSFGAITAEGALRLSDREAVVGLREMTFPLGLPLVDPSEVEKLARRIHPSYPPAYAAWVEQIRAAMEFASGLGGGHGGARFVINLGGKQHELARDLRLRLSDVEFAIPFQNPRGLRVRGGAGFSGFMGFLEPLNHLTLSLGVSADMLFVSLDAANATVHLPPIGPYEEGSITFGQLMLGFGYTRRSLAVAISGAIALPPRLVEELDTSEELGAGVRLPRNTALGFRFDLIPVPYIGVIPVVDFALDLRKPGLAGIADTRTCTPEWDGLQLHVPGAFRIGLKYLSYSPFFGPMICPTAGSDFDIMLGNERNGLSLVLDRFLGMAGLFIGVTGGFTVQLPMLASQPTPFFEHVCFNARLAGFGVNVHLRHPYPGFSPFALFELLALLSDPANYKLDPGGELANVFSIALTDATITLPPALLPLFAGVGERLSRPIDKTLNLATFLPPLQWAMQALQPVVRAALESLEGGAEGIRRMLRQLATQPPALDPGALLAVLPPELRTARLNVSFGGFTGRALLALITPEQAAAELARRGKDPAAPPTPAPLAPGAPFDVQALVALARRVPAPAGQPGHHDPDAPGNNLFADELFASFQPRDLQAIPRPKGALSSIVAAAEVSLFEQQRYTLLGLLFEDGSFSLVSTTTLEPLRLRVAGLPEVLPLAIQGRLMLTGRAHEPYARVSASLHGTWNVLPGVLSLRIGDSPVPLPIPVPIRPPGYSLPKPAGARPATLELDSRGRFALNGRVKADLFGGAGTIRGTVDINENHCLIEGTLQHQAGDLVDLTILVRGRIGPGARFELTGQGRLQVLGLSIAEARVTLTERGVTLEAPLGAGQYMLQGVPFSCPEMSLRGTMSLRDSVHPEFELQGASSFELFGARIDGLLAMSARQGVTAVRLAGRMSWQGREWLEARVEVSNQGVALEARTSFDFDLGPRQLGVIQLAGLRAGLGLSGRFELDAGGTMFRFDIRGDVLLGLRLPGNAQHFPIAVSSFHVKQDFTPAAPLEKLRVKLLSVRELLPIPWSSFAFEVSLPDQFRLHVRDHTVLDIPFPVFDAGSLAAIPHISADQHDYTFTPFYKVRVTGGPEISLSTKDSQELSIPGSFEFDPGAINFAKARWTKPSFKYNSTKVKVPTSFTPKVDWQKVNVDIEPDTSKEVKISIPTHFRLDFGSNWRPPQMRLESTRVEVPTSFQPELTWKSRKVQLPPPPMPGFDVFLVWNKAERRFDLEIAS